jgi:hypothetical protein
LRNMGLAQTLDDGGVGHPAGLTHGLQTVPPAALLESVHQRGHDAGTTGAQRVADRNGAAVDVGLGQIRSGVMRPGAGDRGHAVWRAADGGSGTAHDQSLAYPLQTLTSCSYVLIYNFPFLISSPIFRIGVRFFG